MTIELINKDVLARLSSNPGMLDFVMKLKPDELESLKMFLTWSPSLIARFRDQPAHLSVLHRVWDLVDRDSFVKSYFTIYDHPTSNKDSLIDAFSQGQLDSKNWLIDVVRDLKLDLGRTWTLCGWYGTLAYLMFLRYSEINFQTIRSFDIDPSCAWLADTLNRPAVIAGWKFKATTMDVNDMFYDDFKYVTTKYDGSKQEVLESADTIINTSCDHMDRNKWFERIPTGKLVILQNNDFVEHDDHVNNVSSITELKDRYPMREILYQGSIDCRLYRRFMLIGRM